MEAGSSPLMVMVMYMFATCDESESVRTCAVRGLRTTSHFHNQGQHTKDRQYFSDRIVGLYVSLSCRGGKDVGQIGHVAGRGRRMERNRVIQIILVMLAKIPSTAERCYLTISSLLHVYPMDYHRRAHAQISQCQLLSCHSHLGY